MPVKARRLVRKMRGGAQAHLLETADGHFYVVKFLNNPQHRRILVNEWIASVFLQYLGLSSPATALVEIDRDFIAANPEMTIQLGSQTREVEPGWHFGSRFPGDPARSMVYDFLPDTILCQVENRSEFPGMLAFDQWMGNADARQSIFFRAKLREWLPAYEAHPLRLGLVTQMVDHGFVFGGPQWSLSDSPLLGLYFRPKVYSGICGIEDFEPWISRIQNFPESVVDKAVREIPGAWLDGDDDLLNNLLTQLVRRCQRVPDLLEACRQAKPEWFPNWR
jgi:hypothetical protein